MSEPLNKNSESGEEPRVKLPPAEPRGYFEGESMTRRHVFTVASQAIGGVAAAAVVLPVVGFAVAPLFMRGEERWEAVGAPSDFGPEDYKQVVITETPGIGEVGKTTAYVRRGSEAYDEDPNEFIAISTRCAHLGCPVRFVQAAQNFICPCHGGVYDFLGKRRRRTAGASARPFPDPGAWWPGGTRSPLLGDQPAQGGARARPRRVHRRHLGVPLPAASVHLPTAQQLI